MSIHLSTGEKIEGLETNYFYRRLSVRGGTSPVTTLASMHYNSSSCTHFCICFRIKAGGSLSNDIAAAVRQVRREKHSRMVSSQQTRLDPIHEALEKAASNIKKMFSFRRSEYGQAVDSSCTTMNVQSLSASTPESSGDGEPLEAECHWTPSNTIASKPTAVFSQF